jgi:hypothetical protein
LDEIIRQQLQKKREALLQTIRVQQYAEQHILRPLSLYQHLQETYPACTLKYLAANMDVDFDAFCEAVKQVLPPEQKNLAEAIINSKQLPAQEELELNFPSQRELRYSPSHSPQLYEENAALALETAIEGLKIAEQPVLLFYNVYTPVLQINLTIARKEADQIFEPHNDVTLLALDNSWLIFRSLEDEWYWLHKN